MRKKSLEHLMIVLLLSISIFFITNCSNKYEGKAVRIVFDYETETFGTYANSITTNIFYEGIVKSFKENEYIILDVHRDVFTFNRSKFTSMDEETKVEEKKVKLKDRQYSIKIIANSKKEYLAKKGKENQKQNKK